MGLEASASDDSVHYGDKSMVGRATLFVAVVLGLIAVGFMAAGAVRGDTVTIVFGVAVLLVALPVFRQLMLFRRALCLDVDALRIPRFSRSTTIPLTDVAGVGLVFVRTADGRQTGWYLMVWRSNGQSERTLICDFPKVWTVTPDGRHSLRLRVTGYDPLASDEVRRLASSHAATVAADVYSRVLARQGPSGPLAVRQLQKHIPAQGRWPTWPIVAFWSPDGVAGRVGAVSPGERAAASDHIA